MILACPWSFPSTKNPPPQAKSNFTILSGKMNEINDQRYQIRHEFHNSPVKLLVLTLTVASTCSSATTICPPCGAMPVPYPLSTAHGCGDGSYRVRCGNSTLFFDTLNNSYAITSIDPTIQRLTIKPSPLIPDRCVTADHSHGGIQLNASLPFNITSSNTILYFNCSNTLLQSPLNCTSSNLCHVYGNSSDGSACRDARICCTFRAGGSTTSYMIRVRESGCSAYTSFTDLNPTLPVDTWPDPGVEIQWSTPMQPACRDSRDCDRNSSCGTDPSGNGVARCLCEKGLSWDPLKGVCIMPSADSTCHGSLDCGSSTKASIIAGIACGLGLGLLSIVGILMCKRRRRIKAAGERLAREREEILSAGGRKAAKVFTGKEMKKATNNFSKDRLLGVGGYGEVYKGLLDDGEIVAVKCAKLGNTKSTDQVLNEVRILCQVNHRSLVCLLGCCVELAQPIMVYEYIQNGTLSDHLHGRRGVGRQLSWSHRLRVAHDTADALAYLHFSANPPIYHRDVKSSNILLDEKLNSRVSDFGLSRLAQSDLSHISTCAQGTLGYLDPEYYRKYQLTDKSDVYSFGVVLLELLTSQKALDFDREEEDVNLVVYAQRMAEEEKLMEIIDPLLRNGASDLELDTMKALGFLALSCLEDKRQNRPSMKEVVEEIEYIISVSTSMKLENEISIEGNLINCLLSF